VWCEAAQFSAGFGCDGVAKAVEPGPWIQVLFSRHRFFQHSVVGVSHDEEANGAVLLEVLCRPVALPVGSPGQLGLIHGVIAEHGAQQIDQADSQVRVQELVYRRRQGVLNRSMDQPSLPAGLGNSIAVDCGDCSIPDMKLRHVGTEGESQILFPEIAPPPIMIASHHDDRDLPPKPRQCRNHSKAAPGNHPGIREPEVKQVTVHQQTVAQERYRVEKFQQRRLSLRRRRSQVGIRYDDEGSTQHGAKDGLLPPPGPDQGPSNGRHRRDPLRPRVEGW